MRKIILLCFYTLAFITASYLRESILSSLPGVLLQDSWLSGLAVQKALLSLLFFVMFFLLSVGIVHALFRKRIFIWITSAIYLIVGLLSALAFAAGLALHHAETGYKIAHSLLLFTQSPILAMILVPSFYLYRSNEGR